MKFPARGSILLLVVVWVLLALTGCAFRNQIIPTPMPFPTLTPQPIATLAPSKTPRLPTAVATITRTPEPVGCQKPGDDTTRVKVNGVMLNQRTLEMLKNAQKIYGGEIEITGWAIIQGSYQDVPHESFGTHAGGGAVDLSVMRKDSYTILKNDIEPLVHALRVAGFAAWYRDSSEIPPNALVHIHAIAIGDHELSLPAQDQLTGKFGYFLGYTGLAQPDGNPRPDHSGGPVMCQWMIDLGYSNQSLVH